MGFPLGMTPHFTIRVWGRVDTISDELSRLLGEPRLPRVPICEIELDTTEVGSLTIHNHRGLEFVPQKMLTAAPEQLTLWHQEDR